jgi:hypothetical protein
VCVCVCVKEGMRERDEKWGDGRERDEKVRSSKGTTDLS